MHCAPALRVGPLELAARACRSTEPRLGCSGFGMPPPLRRPWRGRQALGTRMQASCHAAPRIPDEKGAVYSEGGGWGWKHARMQGIGRYVVRDPEPESPHHNLNLSLA